MKQDKKDTFNLIPRDFAKVEQFINDVNEHFNIEIAIIKDARKYILLKEMLEIANKHGFENAKEEIKNMIKENIANDLTEHRFIMLSKKLYDNILSKRANILDVLNQFEENGEG